MNTTFRLDSHGHLAETDHWNEAWVIKVCQEENLNYSADLHLACCYVRKFYDQFKLEPTIFLISKFIHLNAKNIDSPGLWLSCLFPQDTLRQLAKASGLSLPASCLRSFDKAESD